MKPRDSSEEEHDAEGDLPAGAFSRNVSGVVAARGAQAPENEDEDEKTVVDPNRLPLSNDQQAALARRIRNALGQTLPLGTPAPGAAAKAPRSAYTSTMILGGRQSPGLPRSESPAPMPVPSAQVPPAPSAQVPSAPAAQWQWPPAQPRPAQSPSAQAPSAQQWSSPQRPSPAAPWREDADLREPAGWREGVGLREDAAGPDWGVLRAPASAPPELPATFRSEPVSERLAPDSKALRASFVRPVGPPTVPPPRRGRRPSSPDLGGEADEAEHGDHEAFALERPLTMPPPPPGAARVTGDFSAAIAASTNVSPARREVAPLSTGVMLPPPPQPGDYELASRPSSLPPAPRLQSPAAGFGLERPGAPRAPARPLLIDLPSANPFEGFEAPRETFAQRFLIVFVVALAVVGLFALAAIGFGLLGKTRVW